MPTCHQCHHQFRVPDGDDPAEHGCPRGCVEPAEASEDDSSQVAKTYYCIRWAESTFFAYRGTDLNAAAEAMQPGTVFGAGPKQSIADSESLSRAMIARRGGRGKHGGRRSA